jgi:hypothetical protein
MFHWTHCISFTYLSIDSNSHLSLAFPTRYRRDGTTPPQCP